MTGTYAYKRADGSIVIAFTALESGDQELGIVSDKVVAYQLGMQLVRLAGRELDIDRISGELDAARRELEHVYEMNAQQRRELAQRLDTLRYRDRRIRELEAELKRKTMTIERRDATIEQLRQETTT